MQIAWTLPVLQLLSLDGRNHALATRLYLKRAGEDLVTILRRYFCMAYPFDKPKNRIFVFDITKLILNKYFEHLCNALFIFIICTV